MQIYLLYLGKSVTHGSCRIIGALNRSTLTILHQHLKMGKDTSKSHAMISLTRPHAQTPVHRQSYRSLFYHALAAPYHASGALRYVLYTGECRQFGNILHRFGFSWRRVVSSLLARCSYDGPGLRGYRWVTGLWGATGGYRLVERYGYGWGCLWGGLLGSSVWSFVVV
jgi:hypothetical protein